MARPARILAHAVGLLVASLVTYALASVPVTISFQLEGQAERTISGEMSSPSPYLVVNSDFGTIHVYLENIGRIDWSPSQQKHIITFTDGRSQEAVTIFANTAFVVKTTNFSVGTAALRTLVLDATLPTPQPSPPVATGTVTGTAMVAGQIQTFDPWTSGEVAVNDWAKPLYRMWFDTNGNPEDGAWGNGQGPHPAEIWLDSGRLGFRWDAGTPDVDDDTVFWPIRQEAPLVWSEHGIRAWITSDGRTLQVQLPLALLGSPRSLEVSVMASPWTTSACDNLSPGANSRPAWIVVPDTVVASSHALADAQADTEWPESLTDYGLGLNFDLVNATVRVSGP